MVSLLINAATFRIQVNVNRGFPLLPEYVGRHRRLKRNVFRVNTLGHKLLLRLCFLTGGRTFFSHAGSPY
jgi:hypothetical protein